MNITKFELLKNQTIPKYNFYEIYCNSSLNSVVDFDLMMITNLIGNIVLRSRGFRGSFIIFMILNIIPLYHFF